MECPARPSLSRFLGSRGWLSVLSSLALPLGVTLILVPFRSHFANAAAALVLVMVVTAVAVFGDRRAGVTAAVSSGVWFDYFLTRPYEQFSILAARDVETTVSLVVVGLLVTEIAARSRRYYAVASDEGNYLALVRDLSDLVATGASSDKVIAAARESLMDLLMLQECRFQAGTTGGRPRLQRNGEVELGHARFDVGHDGLPEGGIDLIVQSRSRQYGSFVIGAAERRGVSIAQRVVALVLADQVGAALAAERQDQVGGDALRTNDP